MNQSKRRMIVKYLVIALVVVHVYSVGVMLQRTRYEKDFNCVNFTSESIGWFNKIGIDAYQVVGVDKETGTGHSWVCIKPFGYILHYEPQEFMFFYPAWFYNDIWINNRTD